MKIVIFGLTISSSWGNGHATLWRGLCRALAADRHHVVFFEHDAPYYAAARDLHETEIAELVIYGDWTEIGKTAARHVREADAAIVTSYCPDALVATELVTTRAATSIFYDLDTPVTLSALRRGESVSYIGGQGLSDFDLVLSYTGGTALNELRTRLGAKRTAALYGHVDPHVHRRSEAVDRYRADLSYLGTYAADRQAALERLFLEPAAKCPEQRFLIGGAQYPKDFPWRPNLFFARHVAPTEHAAFYSSSRLTLNVTRPAMAEMGWCPSGRLFEAAACGTAILSDQWDGLSAFFEPGDEILVAHDAADTVAALRFQDWELAQIGNAARERALAEHTSAHRAKQMLALLERARAPLTTPEMMRMQV